MKLNVLLVMCILCELIQTDKKKSDCMKPGRNPKSFQFSVDIFLKLV